MSIRKDRINEMNIGRILRRVKNILPNHKYIITYIYIYSILDNIYLTNIFINFLWIFTRPNLFIIFIIITFMNIIKFLNNTLRLYHN